MPKLYSYVLRYDDGAAPNPFWNVCTLTICKPAIRRTANVGDWIIGTGSKNSHCNDGSTYDLSNCLVYAMKVRDKMTLAKYDKHCQQYLPGKIPNWNSNDWRTRVGDCIYTVSDKERLSIREGSVHNKTNEKTDLSGVNALLADHFYYFGEEALPLPQSLTHIIKQNQGHKVIVQKELIKKFENWIEQFDVGKLCGEPQLKHEFDRILGKDLISKCASRDLIEDDNESEEIFC